MKLFFLVLLFFVVHVVNGQEKRQQSCDISEDGKPNIHVNEAFIAEWTMCTEWFVMAMEYPQHLYIKGDVTQDMFNLAFSKVKSITIDWLIFEDNKMLTSLVFPSLESLYYLQLAFKNCPYVTTISFPELEKNVLRSLEVTGMDSLDAPSIDSLINKFVGEGTPLRGDLCDGINIVEVSFLSRCKLMNRMIFAENTNGTVNTTITYVKDELKIIGTQLRNLDFLKLQPLVEKRNTTCEIRKNKFCDFDKESVVKMLEEVYEKCRIEDNSDGECGIPTTIQSTSAPTTTKTTIAAPTTAMTTTTPPEILVHGESLPTSGSIFVGLFIGSAAFNVLLVASIVALIITVVKLKKKVGEVKQGTAKIAKKVETTPTAVTIKNERPVVVNKESSSVPPPAPATKVTDQNEEAVDTTGTGLDLDTSGSGSDSTGTDGPTEVRWSVRALKRN